MKFIVVLLFAILAFSTADRWAVLVAGSNGWGNYRHQADLGHAYQILIEAGYDDDKIILFSYDDIARTYKNPFPGQIFNRPGNDSPNVYPGSGRIDYSNYDCIPNRFLSVLKGEPIRMGSGKTLKSGPNDEVFIAYFDHGATGLIGFPPMSDYNVLYADELINALKYMHNHNMYSKLVFFMEACESGSMFQHLPSNMNIYALTASNASKPSAAAYCDNTNVHGRNLNTCLGDLFSVSWMETVDKSSSSDKTLDELYEIVKKLTTASPVQKFGTESMGNLKVSEFLGKSSDDSWLSSWFTTADNIRNLNRPIDFINSRDAAIQQGYNEMINTGDSTLFREQTILRDSTDRFMQKVAKKAMNVDVSTLLEDVAGLNDSNMACLKVANEKIFKDCGMPTEYGLKYSKAVLNMCSLMPMEIVLNAIEC